LLAWVIIEPEGENGEIADKEAVRKKRRFDQKR
jgi:hypothetical protein